MIRSYKRSTNKKQIEEISRYKLHVKRVLVIQMTETEEEEIKRLKKEREEELRKRRIEDEQKTQISIFKEELHSKIHEYYINILEQWTGRKVTEIVIDSTEYNWNFWETIFCPKIIGKSNLMFIITNDDGEEFGYYFSGQILKKKSWQMIQTIDESFHFNLSSKNNRLSQPMKFPITDTSTSGYILYGKPSPELITIGDITLMKGSLEKQKQSHCNQSDNFEYGGISNALCGKTKFTISQLLVLQMN